MNKEKYLIAKQANQLAGNRKIILWGDDEELRKILLSEFHRKVDYIVTLLNQNVNGSWIRPLSEIKGKSKEIFLLVWGREYDNYYKTLEAYGYRDENDFIYRMHKPIVLDNWDCRNRYEDIYGNVIDAKEGILKQVIFRGCNNSITLGSGNKGMNHFKFDMGSNGSVTISSNCTFSRDVNFWLWGYNGQASLFIGNNCSFEASDFKLINHSANSSVCINNDCSFQNNLSINANSGKQIVVGRDCMFSYDVCLQAGDGHAIFDVSTKMNVNDTRDTNYKDKDCLIIGEHVWVSKRAFILNGTNIGIGSIVGAGSVVKGKFPNNCSIAGNPAKAVKNNVAWARQNGAQNIEACGREYQYQLTNDAKPALTCRNVLVIGGTRFMGVQLVYSLLAGGNRVTIATRGTQPDNFGNRVQRLKMDLVDRESCKAALKGKKYDVVFDNLAYCSNNVKNVLDFVSCDRYVQLSSVEVYIPTKQNMSESDFNPYQYKQKWCDQTVGYQEGKRQAEACVYQCYKNISAVTVRIPYVTDTERLYFYCKNIIDGIPMNIDDCNKMITFIRAFEVGKFLPWIAAQDNFTGPINLSSVKGVTIGEILTYIEKKLGKKAILDTEIGKEAPFHVFNEQSFSMNMDCAKKLGYTITDINSWFWDLMDKYIERAKKEHKTVNNNTISIVDKEKCTGCGACVNICPKQAISMKTDEEGFIQPYIDKEKCVSCGLCVKKCPTLSEMNFLKKNMICYALMAQDDIREVSSSGGAFTIFADKIMEQNGVVCGSAWTDDFFAEHILIRTTNEIPKLRGSKYVQSNIGSSYSLIKKELEQGSKVMFTGTPCQIDGLYHYLGKDYDNLLTVDLLCRGIASNELFRRMIRENYANKPIKNVYFKVKKPLGWGATTAYEFEDGTVEKINVHNSIWMYAYLANIMDRKSCYSCKFNTVNRVGDISIGDFWGIAGHNKSYDDRKGTSIVMANSEKGCKFIESIKDKCKLLEQVPLQVGVPHNSALCSHVKPTPKRQALYSALNKMPFPAAVDRAMYGKKYDVGIVGWWYNLNYGGTLTYFALNKAIEKLGYSVLMIRRSSSGPQMPNDNTVPMRFAKKQYNISRLYTPREMHWLNYSCRAFVSGSDQLWNPYLEDFSGAEYFLSFVNAHNLKLSYASSFGNVQSINDKYVAKYKPYLSKFDGLSFREDYAVDICKKDFGMDGEFVCDPIFLPDRSEYEKIAADSKISLPNKYQMNFLLDPTTEKIRAYKFLQEKLNLEKVNFTDLQGISEAEKIFAEEKVYSNAEIEDFVSAYANADFILTDSFHGTCLAIIFNKPFISIANIKRGEKRFISLLKWVGLEERLVFDIDEIYSKPNLLKAIDYEPVNRIINEKKQYGLAWLKKHLSHMI